MQKHPYVSVQFHILLEVALQIGSHVAERGQLLVPICGKRSWKIKSVTGRDRAVRNCKYAPRVQVFMTTDVTEGPYAGHSNTVE